MQPQLLEGYNHHLITVTLETFSSTFCQTRIALRLLTLFFAIRVETRDKNMSVPPPVRGGGSAPLCLNRGRTSVTKKLIHMVLLTTSVHDATRKSLYCDGKSFYFI